MADVILLKLSDLSLSQLQQRLCQRQQQRIDFSQVDSELNRSIVAIAEQDIEDIKAEWKRRSATTKTRMRTILRVVPSPES